MLLLAVPALAQFVPEVALRGRAEGWVLLADGTRIEGRFGMPVEINEELRFSITDAQGHKHKIRGRDVVAMGQEIDPRYYLNATAEALEASGVRYREWHRIAVPDGAPTLLPLINPGLDDWLRVYPDPLVSIRPGRSAPGVMSSVTVNGVPVGLMNKNAASFLALPKGGESWGTGGPGRPDQHEQPLVVVRASYEGLWDRLYGTCTDPDGAPFPKPEEVKMADFESHVLAHHQHCSAPRDPRDGRAAETVP